MRWDDATWSCSAPVGPAREIAVFTLRLVVRTILNNDITLAAAIVEQVQPESPDGSTATIDSCIGISLGLLSQ